MNTSHKTLTRSLPAKCAAFLLCLLLALTGLFCMLGALYLYEDGYYSGERRSYAESSLSGRMMSQYESAANSLYFYGTLYTGKEEYALDAYERLLDPANTNYRYAVYNEAGERVAGTAGELGPIETARRHCYTTRNFHENYESYEVLSTLDPAMRVNDGFALQNRLFNALLSMKYWIIVLGALSLLCALALLVFLMCAAGRYQDAEKPECRNLDRVPFDLYLAICVGLIVAAFYTAYAFYHSADVLLLGVMTVLALGGSLAVIIALLMSFAARVKCRNLLHNTVIGWILRQLWRFIKWICRGLRTFCIELPIVWKAALAIAAFFILDAILLALADNNAFSALLFVLLNLAAFVFCIACAIQMKRLQEGAKALADGDFSHNIEEKGLFSEFKKHAGALNGIGAGMGRAIEARMKSERMKTDLITNVSHDLKTPLTSIINYVDLLRKEELPEPSGEYVAVLDRQSQRLKKLSEDVVEASKASSGALNVNMQPTDLSELVNQSMAEYGPRFTENGLTAVVSLPEEPLVVPADGRLLWRALDNLLSNAQKYALEGTRVYVSTAKEGGDACITIKNVSREPLNIDPAELTERFVRGDSSRSAEGSGLGLSIAQSLVALQGGRLRLSIDGDLFRAEIVLSSL